jgi:hypothetical protein
MGHKTQNSYGKVKRKKEHLFFCGYTLKCDMTATADKNPGKREKAMGKTVFFVFARLSAIRHPETRGNVKPKNRWNM